MTALLAISAEEATLGTSVVTAVITLILAGAAVWTAKAARASAAAAQAATLATQALIAPLVTLSGSFGTVEDLDSHLYLSITVKNVGLGPALALFVQPKNEHLELGIELVPGLAPGESHALTWPLGFWIESDSGPYDDRLWADFATTATYSDVQSVNRYEADFHASPLHSEWVEIAGSWEDYPGDVRFDLVDVRPIRSSQ